MAQRVSIVASSFGLFIFLSLFSLPLVSHAQFDLPQIENSLVLSISPRAPGPNENVQVAVDSSFIEMSESDVVWYVNGKLVLRGVGEKNIRFLSGNIGTKTNIEARVTTSDGASASASTSVTPVEVDLLFDSDSYVPAFFRGRALPSAGTTLRLQAIARFKNPDGSFVPESAILYTWKRGSQILGTISGRGKSSARIEAPGLFSTETISVEARSADGAFFGVGSESIPSTDPIIGLYEDHPLFGITYNKQLGSQTKIAGTEITLAAVPFYTEASAADDPSLVYQWAINRIPTTASSTKRSEITIGSKTTESIARVALEISHTKNFFMSARGAWNLVFSSAGDSGGAVKKNVFESSQ